jgi:hypothetical protein
MSGPIMQNDTMERLLDQMHTAILTADFGALGPLAQALELALAGLDRPNQALLQRISHKAARNATCLQAAGRGVRAAVRRLAEVRQNAAGLVTYDGAGKRAAYGGPGQLARRF